MMKNTLMFAQWLHNTYENLAEEQGWRTQLKCQTEFNKLPKRNQAVMIRMACKIKTQFRMFFDRIIDKRLKDMVASNIIEDELLKLKAEVRKNLTLNTPDANNSHLRKQGETSAVGNDVSNGVLDKRGETCPDSTPKENVMHVNQCGAEIKDEEGKVVIACGDDLGGDNNEFAQCPKCREKDYSQSNQKGKVKE